MKRFLTILLALSVLSVTESMAGKNPKDLPRNIYSGIWDAGHIQGIALDTEHEHIYMSFTTVLVKADLQGNVIGTVTGLLGHLGCLEFNDEDGRLYGSLEYKDDSIGKGILRREKSDKQLDNAFYVAIFDVDKITRTGMDAEKDGIMTTVYLPTVLEDYTAEVKCSEGVREHRYGCSGFDGITFGPEFGKSGGKRYLTIAYGIYGDTERSDNDYQVLLQYDTDNWKSYESILSQDAMHKNGPAEPDRRYFVYTGNTSWGVQNLEYDAQSNLWFMAAYKGKKPNFANFCTFVVDGNAAPVSGKLKGVPYHKGKAMLLTLLDRGTYDAANGIHGWRFKYGTTGLCSLGDGYFYISHNGRNEQGQFGNIKLYRFVGSEDKAYELVE